MDKRKDSAISPAKYQTTVERRSERELVVIRIFNGPAHVVFSAWTKPELLKRWWIPKSCGASFLSCEADVRTGGTYRFVFSHPAAEQPTARGVRRYIALRGVTSRRYVTPSVTIGYALREVEDRGV